MVLFEVVKFLIKDYVVNLCLANPDSEAVSHSEICSTNLWASWGAIMINFFIIWSCKVSHWVAQCISTEGQCDALHIYSLFVPLAVMLTNL